MRDAAVNAIVVADSLVKSEQRELKELVGEERLIDKQQSLPFGQREKTPLTPAETWLSMAYDNFIKLFPFDEKTPSILINAGALFYTHNQFPEALKYFKTLVKYFPKSDEVYNAHFAILDSYFGRKDYESAEMIAKTIMDSNVPPELKSKAEKRMGEAIFLKAQVLAESGQSTKAAEEFYRMALEAPTLEFADRALFNAAAEFEKAKQYPSAIRAYELLRNSYTGSGLMADVLNNLALNYGEIKDFKKGGDRYEQLHVLLKVGDRKENALHNAWIYYANGKYWTDAIRVGGKYVALYPDSSEALDIFYRGAEFSLAMNDTASAIDIYQQFPQNYPNSALGVDAYYKLGQLFQKQNRKENAIQAYQNAYDFNQKLVKQNLANDDFIACEALYLNAKLLQENYNAITFKMQSKENLSVFKLEKETLLKELVDKYHRVAGFGTFRVPEALYQVGLIYEHYATNWTDQEIEIRDPVQRAVRQKTINEEATTVYGQAYKAFKQSISLMDKILQKSVQTETQNDTVRLNILKWQDLAKEKVSETLYHMAELNDQSIKRILDVPVPSDLGNLARLEYQSQILLKAIQPLIMVVVAAHKRNLSVADSLQLSNQWTEESSRQIKQTLSLLGSEYNKLAIAAVQTYTQVVSLYENRVLDEKKSVSDETISLMADLIDVSKTYGAASVQFYEDGIFKSAESGLMVEDRKQLQDQMIFKVLSLIDIINIALQNAIHQQERANQLFTDTENIIFEDALALFEDHDYFLGGSIVGILERAIQAETRLAIQSLNSGWLKVRLVKFDPVNYSEVLGIPVEHLTLPTDTTWMFTDSQVNNWQDIFADTIVWHSSTLTEGDSVLDTNTAHKIIGEIVSIYRKPFPVYFKKAFRVAGLPVEGKMALDQGHSKILIVNRDVFKIDENTVSINILNSLKKGENWLVLETDHQNPMCKGFVTVQYIPEQWIPKMELAQYE